MQCGRVYTYKTEQLSLKLFIFSKQPALVCARRAMQSAANDRTSSSVVVSKQLINVFIPSADEIAGSLSGMMRDSTTT